MHVTVAPPKVHQFGGTVALWRGEEEEEKEKGEWGRGSVRGRGSGTCREIERKRKKEEGKCIHKIHNSMGEGGK